MLSHASIFLFPAKRLSILFRFRTFYRTFFCDGGTYMSCKDFGHKEQVKIVVLKFDNSADSCQLSRRSSQALSKEQVSQLSVGAAVSVSKQQMEKLPEDSREALKMVLQNSKQPDSGAQHGMFSESDVIGCERRSGVQWPMKTKSVETRDGPGKCLG